jgi:hypothetical protein
LLGIEFPFLAIRFSCGDDANHFLATGFAHCVRDQQNQLALDRPDGLLAMLAAFESILQRKREWISKHQCRRLETQTMFSNVRSDFVGIPFETNRHDVNVTTFLSQQNRFI